MIARQLVPHVGHGACRVVGHRLDHDRDAARTVRFVQHFDVVHAFQFARALLDGAVDVVLGHRHRLRIIDGRTQPGIAAGITSAQLGGHGDFADQPREERTALVVRGGLGALDRFPFTMSCHRPAP